MPNKGLKSMLLSGHCGVSSGCQWVPAQACPDWPRLARLVASAAVLGRSFVVDAATRQLANSPGSRLWLCGVDQEMRKLRKNPTVRLNFRPTLPGPVCLSLSLSCLLPVYPCFSCSYCYPHFLSANINTSSVYSTAWQAGLGSP